MSTFFHGCGIPPVTLACPPNTAMPGPCGVPPVTLGCNQGGAAQAQTVHGTAATLCTRIPACDQPIQTWFHTCGVPPVTLTCNQGAGAQAQVQNNSTLLGPTGWQGCQPTAYPGCQGQTGYVQCAHTLATVCTSPGFCTGGAGAQAQDTNTILGPTAYQGCQGQTSYNECAHTLATVCTSPGFCHGGAGAQVQDTNTILGPTAYQGCQKDVNTLLGPTAYQGCQGQTGYNQCAHTYATVCTSPGFCPDGAGAQAIEHVTEYNHDCTMTCPGAGAQAQNVGPTGTQGCTMPPNCLGHTAYLTCPQGGAGAQVQDTNTLLGPTAYQGCQGQTGYNQCAHTYATVCTSPGFCPDGSGAQAQAAQGTAATLCTQSQGCILGGPTSTEGCTMPPNCLGHTAYLTCPQAPNTHLMGCTTVTAAPDNSGAQAQNVGHTAYQGCPGQTGYDACGHTLATVCTQIACDRGGHTSVLGCTTVTSPPETVACQAQAQNVGNTGWETCVQTAPPACYGQTGTQGCTMPPNCLGQTAYLTCPQGGAGAQVQDTNTILGPTAYQGCQKDVNTLLGPTAYQGCQGQTGYNQCAHTYATVCTSPGFCPDGAGAQAIEHVTEYNHDCTMTCPGAGAQAQNVGPTGTQGCTMPPNCYGQTSWLTCTQGGAAQAQAHVTEYNHDCTMTCPGAGAQAQNAGANGTMATVCTQVQCATHMIGCTGYLGCGQTMATVCTQVQCPPQGGAHAQAQVPTIPVADCIPTRNCATIDCIPTVKCTGIPFVC